MFTMRNREGVALLAHLRWCTYADILLTPTRTAFAPLMPRLA